MHLNGENRNMSFYCRILSRNEQMDRRVMRMKIFLTQWSYIHVYDHNIQTASSLKLLCQSKPNFLWSSLRKSE